MEHLSRYDLILMLRAIWTLPIVRYQLVEIPVELLDACAPRGLSR